jgi:hypothetical protein
LIHGCLSIFLCSLFAYIQTLLLADPTSVFSTNFHKSEQVRGPTPWRRTEIPRYRSAEYSIIFFCFITLLRAVFAVKWLS